MKELSREEAKSAVKAVARTGGSDLKSWDSVLDHDAAQRDRIAEHDREMRSMQETIDDRGRQIVDLSTRLRVALHDGEQYRSEIAALRAELEKWREESRRVQERHDNIAELFEAPETALTAIRKPAYELAENFAWSGVTADCEEMRLRLNGLIDELRAAMRVQPAQETK